MSNNKVVLARDAVVESTIGDKKTEDVKVQLMNMRAFFDTLTHDFNYQTGDENLVATVDKNEWEHTSAKYADPYKPKKSERLHRIADVIKVKMGVDPCSVIEDGSLPDGQVQIRILTPTHVMNELNRERNRLYDQVTNIIC